MDRTAPASAAGRGLLPFLCAGHTIDHMFTLLYPTVVVVALESVWRLPFRELNNLALVGFILFGLGAPLAGWLADRWSAVATMAVYFAGIGVAAVLAGLSTGPWTMALALGLIGLFASIYHPVGIPMIVQTAGDRRGRQLGINGVAGSLGMATAPLVASGLAAAVHWRAVFILPGLAAIALGLWFWLRFRHVDLHVEHRRAEGDDADRGRFIRIMLVLAVITVSSGVVFQAMTVGLPKIVAERVSLFDGHALLIGGTASVILLLGGAAQLMGGFLSERFPLRWLYFAIYAVMPPALLLAAGARDLPVVLLLAVVLAITTGSQPIADNLFARFVPPRWLATAFGFRFALSIGSSSLAVPLVGWVYGRTGDFGWLFYVLAAFAAVVVAAILLLPSHAPGELARAPAAPAPAE